LTGSLVEAENRIEKSVLAEEILRQDPDSVD
jgi:hypothetical protein